LDQEKIFDEKYLRFKISRQSLSNRFLYKIIIFRLTGIANPCRERFPLAEFKYVPGAGHWVHSQKPKEFLDLLLPFLK